jgi:hypothetical protein
MFPLALVFSTLLAAAPASAPTALPTPAYTKEDGPIILFLVDNSASLPSLDPEEKRVIALEKMFGFLDGHPYRSIMFAGRHESYIDDPTKYNNRGQWTDFYFAFLKTKEIVDSYPAGTKFKMVLLTDAIVDPGPQDWKDMNVPEGMDIKTYSVQKTLDLLREMQIPLYVVLIGDVPKEGLATGDREQSPTFVLDMVKAANGRLASPFAQTVASFFGDNGVLLRKFVFRIGPTDGLKKLEPVVRRISAPPRPTAELELSALLTPFLLLLFVFLGILVRSFPGPGDLEILELSTGLPVHIGVDKMRSIKGGWASTGLSLVAAPREAGASLVYQAPSLDLTGKGLDTDGLEATGGRLMAVNLESMRTMLENLSNQGNRDEKIFVLNLDYMAKNMESDEAEKYLTMAIPDRRRMNPLDFLRAKAHLLSDEPLRAKLTDARIQFTSYGRYAERRELKAGASVRIGRYGFLVKDITKGGRKDVRLVLYYDRVPSLLGLKTILPDFFQRAFRMRRSSQRIVA